VQTQKDHVEAYSFLMGRMTSALVVGEASYLEVPARRARTGLVIGAALALLITAGFIVFGLIAHASKPKAPAPAPAPSASVAPARGTAPVHRSRPARNVPVQDVSRVLPSVRVVAWTRPC
jgi:hypothetical protein